MGQHTSRSLHPVTQLDLQARGSWEDHIYSRSELDEADAFPAFYPVSNFLIEHDAPRQQTHDL